MKRTEPTEITKPLSTLCACGHAAHRRGPCLSCDCEVFSVPKDFGPAPCCHGWFPWLNPTPQAAGAGASTHADYSNLKKLAGVLPALLLALCRCGAPFSVAVDPEPTKDVAETVLESGTGTSEEAGHEPTEASSEPGEPAEASPSETSDGHETVIVHDSGPDAAKDAGEPCCPSGYTYDAFTTTCCINVTYCRATVACGD